ncbi:hypothetical protein B0O99DRAFT_619718 [Bisporella sp. PMI_857]|nr:hypothetical protein B0O99DRAFT_619718 [Bisporella sp. PMI_857]
MNKGKIMRKLLGQPVSTRNEPVDSNTPVSPQPRPGASPNIIFKTGTPVACLDRSPDSQRVVIAGQKIFKTLRLDGSTITEDVDLRSIISSYATAHDPSAATADLLNIRAVKWSHQALDTTIITACGNGRITLYDLNRIGEGLEYVRIHEHARQVHKLDINRFKGNWLLSASQDGTIKSFDLRTPVMGRNGPTFRPWHTYKCNADAVRDVKWSPTDGMEFACSTDAGVVQKWDVRKPTAPILKITAHQYACHAIDWHPDGDHLISGGIDQHCHVWNVSKTAERGQKPRYSFTTPAPVSAISWRPANKGRAAQVAVSYDDSRPSHIAAVHLWDLARPGMPYKEIERWDSSPTGILWTPRGLLWSADREGNFTQTEVASVPPLIDSRSLSTFAFSPTGDVLMLLDERPPPPRPRPSVHSPDSATNYHTANKSQLAGSRSDSEDDGVGSFLGPRQWKKKRHKEQTPLMSTTPPNHTGMVDSSAMNLDDAVNITGLFKPRQTMAIGQAPSIAKKFTYQYFSNRYLRHMIKMSAMQTDIYVPAPLQERVASTVEYFARTAEGVSHYRLAQTWRLLGYTICLLLSRRASYHRQSRLAMGKSLTTLEAPKDSKESPSPSPTPTPRNQGEETPRRFPRVSSPFESPLHPATKTFVNGESESTSNVATPLVRPVRDPVVHEARRSMYEPLPIEDDVFSLPEAVHSNGSEPITVGSGSQASDQTTSSMEGYDFYGMESFTPAIDFVAPPKRVPLRLEYSENSEIAKRMQPKRHDSGESFTMFSTSGDSQPGKFMNSSDSDGQGRNDSFSLRERVSTWENSYSMQADHRASIDSGAPTMSTDSSGENYAPSSFHAHRSSPKDAPRTAPTPPIFRIQEASFRSTAKNQRAPGDVEESISPWSASPSIDPNIIESDFLPWPNDPEFLMSPLDPTTLVQRSITFEAQTGALNASAMILLFRPLLPDGAIDDIQASAILAQYHSRLQNMRLFTEASMLRNLCVPKYPNVFAMAQEQVNVGYFCTDCRKPLENDPTIPGSHWRCPRCQHSINGCVVCLQRHTDDLDFEDANPIDNVLWWHCPGCGHGGHTMCMAAWHEGAGDEDGTTHSGGSCPLEGCLHPCLPGSWRDTRAEEKKAAKQKELDLMVRENARQASNRGGRGVRRDAREVAQSKAVEGVRVALGISGLERKKSVKIITPGEAGPA